MYRTKCLKCHNIGHLAWDCNMKWVPKQQKCFEKPNQVWRRKHDEPKILEQDFVLNC